MNGYELSRLFFNWSFENPEKITPNMGILYFFIIEHCNRLGWKEKFGLPTAMTMEAIGIGSYKTYKTALDMLVENGFITIIEWSKNQHSANIVALVNFAKATTKASPKQTLKQLPTHVQSKYSINKPNNKETNNDDNASESSTTSPSYYSEFFDLKKVKVDEFSSRFGKVLELQSEHMGISLERVKEALTEMAENLEMEGRSYDRASEHLAHLRNFLKKRKANGFDAPRSGASSTSPSPTAHFIADKHNFEF